MVYLARNIPRKYDDFYKLDDVSRIKVVQAILVALSKLDICKGPINPKTDDMEKCLLIDALYGPNTAGGLAQVWAQAGLVEPIGGPWSFYIGEETYRVLLTAYGRVTRKVSWGSDWGIRYTLKLADRPAVGPVSIADRKPYWPLDREYHTITSKYGWRMINGKWEEHGGMDIGAPYHSRVYASKAGTVEALNTVETTYDMGDDFVGNARGNFVLLKHEDGTATRYLHLTAVYVGSRGEPVDAGQAIGTVGATGRSYGAHLHFDYGTGISGENIVDRVNPLTELYPDFLPHLHELTENP